VEKNLVQAYRWLAKAASAGYEDAAKALIEVEAQMTPDQLEQAKALAKRSKSAGRSLPA